MRASLVRTGSVPVQKLIVPHPPKVSLHRQLSISGDKIAIKNSPRTSMHLNSNDRRDFPARSLDREFTERDAIRSSSQRFDMYMKLNITASGSFSASTPDEEYLSERESREISEKNCLSEPNYAGVCAERGYSLQEIGLYGGGAGDDGDHGITTFTGGNGGDRMKIGAYYEEMLKSNPTEALLLGNYAKFLYEVEKDMTRAEEYYKRAILVNPADGELLSMYGKLIWETQRDENRAKSYFDQALHAAPQDCMVLGSYAHFMWEAGEDGEAIVCA